MQRRIWMVRVRPVPFTEMDEGMRALVQASDEALGGSEWIQAFAHAPDIFKPFARLYYEYIMTDRAGVSLKLTELVRHVVAEQNQCRRCCVIHRCHSNCYDRVMGKSPFVFRSRMRDWPEYNRALINRGRLILGFAEQG